MNKNMTFAAIILAFSLSITGCAAGNKSTVGNQNTGNPSNSSQSGTPQSSTQGTPTSDTAEKPIVIDMYNAQKTSIGTVELKKTTAGVEMKLNVTGLKPGKHGFHMHQLAVCEGPDFKTAGDHFNPDQKKHGMEHTEGAHAGDLPNIEVDSSGKSTSVIVSKLVTLDKGKVNSIVGGDGKSLVIHADPDDGKTDPSGNSGDRIACGILK